MLLGVEVSIPYEERLVVVQLVGRVGLRRRGRVVFQTFTDGERKTAARLALTDQNVGQSRPDLLSGKPAV